MVIWETIRFLFIELLTSTLYFPVWWYTGGTMKVVQLIARHMSHTSQSLRLGVLFKYLFQPMFGQTDFAGRVISFFIRIIDFIVRFLLAIIYMFVLIGLLLLWLALPVLVIGNILFHFGVIDLQGII